MKIRFWEIIILSGIVGLGPGTIWACSVCRCGDNAFQFSSKGFALPDQNIAHRFALDLGNLYASKSNGLSGSDGIGTEHQREFRPSVRLSYNLLNDLSFAIEAPFQFRKIIARSINGAETERSSGFGDAELSGVWMTNISNSDGRFFTGGLSLAVKLPTGNNNIKRAGGRLDEHLQAGSGAYDWQIGAAISRMTCSSRYFTSLYYRHNGTNSFDYHYGNATLYNLGGQWPLTDRISASAQVNGRYAARDINQNLFEENTGGWVTYLTPGIKLNLTETAAFSTAVQIPIYQKLYGVQTEKAVLSAGLGISF
jgi:hypothetical protein